jgi:hypothetical protein
VARHVCLVLTNPVEGRDDEFNEWYEQQHLDDVLRVPGFVAAQRFRLSGGQSGTHRYLAIYEIETDDIDATNAGLIGAAGTPAMMLSEAMDLSSFSVTYFEEMGPRHAI